jgi:hypothetical protein
MVLAKATGTIDMVRRNSLDFELSVPPVDCIRALRQLCESKGWSLERHEGARLVDRFAIIMPMAQSARTLGLKVLDGPLMGLELTTWSEVRGSAGAVHICSWILPGGPQHPKIQHLMQHWVANLPRCPWRWTFGERSKIGFLLPTWKKSRRSFTNLGFNTEKNAWPITLTTDWMNENEEE